MNKFYEFDCSRIKWKIRAIYNVEKLTYSYVKNNLILKLLMNLQHNIIFIILWYISKIVVFEAWMKININSNKIVDDFLRCIRIWLFKLLIIMYIDHNLKSLLKLINLILFVVKMIDIIVTFFDNSNCMFYYQFAVCIFEIIRLFVFVISILLELNVVYSRIEA